MSLSKKRSTWFRHLRRWHQFVHEPSLTLLLGVEIVFVFAIAPLASAGELSLGVVGCFQFLIGLVAVLAVATHWERGMLALVLLLVGMLTTLETRQPSEQLHLGVWCAILLFTLVLVGAVGRAVFTTERVSTHRIRGGMVVYLTLALLFLAVFAVLETHRPGSFAGISGDSRQQTGQLLYFSLTTLTSTGYGDVLPVHPLARGLATFEAVVGQLFIATLFARLINLHLLTRRS